ncbi:hypothetical protein QE152_g22708 [Popillia japonica]|uniref:Uncharacterized protein n=1 Tax=Popillia japonica TaxID=7064 RepID=A0AAW1KKC3_POPJA
MQIFITLLLTLCLSQWIIALDANKHYDSTITSINNTITRAPILFTNTLYINNNSSRNLRSEEEDDEEEHSDGAGEYIYVVSSPSKNISGILISRAIVASTALENTEEVSLCQATKCEQATLLKIIGDVYFWFLDHNKKVPKQFDFRHYDDADCFSNYEGNRTVIVENTPAETQCEPKCQIGDVLVCNEQAGGIILDDPPRIYTTKDLREMFGVRNSREPTDYRQKSQRSQSYDDHAPVIRSRSDAGGIVGVNSFVSLLLICMKLY